MNQLTIELLVESIIQYQKEVLKKTIAEVSILYGTHSEKGSIWNIWIARPGNNVQVVGKTITECVHKLIEQGEYCVACG